MSCTWYRTKVLSKLTQLRVSLLGIECEVHRDYAHQGFKGGDSQVEWRAVLEEGLEKPSCPQKFKQWLS
jgi:hypothetical protein